MISDNHKRNFDTLCDAVQNGDAVIMECHDKVSGEDVVVICAVWDAPDGTTAMVPFAQLYNANPFERLVPPLPCKQEKGMEFPKAKSDSRLN